MRQGDRVLLENVAALSRRLRLQLAAEVITSSPDLLPTIQSDYALGEASVAKGGRSRGTGLWPLIVVGLFVAWFSGRSNPLPPSSPPANITVQEHSVPARKKLVEPTKPAPTQPVDQPTTAYVTATTLNVRATPARDGAKLGTLSYGTKVLVTELRSGWAALRLTSGQTAWVSAEFLSPSEPTAAQPLKPTVPAASSPNRLQIVQAIIRESMQGYSGNCPCPENRDRAGRRCGARSAWSRAGGARPICYASDVTEAMIERFLARQ